MKWGNLKENKCPKCDKDLMDGASRTINDKGEKILNHPCGFKIREKRMAEIVTSQVSAELESEGEDDNGVF